MSEDAELLRRYTENHSEEAFAELIRRHVDLVHSAALRLVNGDAHRAQDVTQQVFTEFARQAKRLARHPTLVGWLYTTTRWAALRAVRTERRRSAREQEANAMNELLRESAPQPDWERLRPVLEDAMHELRESDRSAVLLRYFQNKSLKEVGIALGLGENAARMRVDRALDKLRGVLLQRGVATSSTLAALISANAVQLAPSGLAASLAATSPAAAAAGTVTLLKIMTATQFKLGISALVVAGATTALVFQHQTQSRLRQENESLRREMAQLKTDNASLSNRLGASADARPQPGDQFAELLRLRGQVAVLRQQKGDLEQALAKAPKAPPRGQIAASVPSTSPLPDDYPKTADDATKSMFELLARGDGDGLTNFDIEGGPQAIGILTNYLHGVGIVDIGQPTNSFGPNMWFVPYTIQFPDGNQKTFRLHVAQDPNTQRWILKGGI
ncbi:MAG TPA: sigma-70 family RNA polymerase sigma factor [Candidatus Acidoferrales bacterium]|nr:sigma-70 family RNA polymerase sigma factor [Candidatus Acidoferrales bacterium]